VALGGAGAVLLFAVVLAVVAQPPARDGRTATATARPETLAHTPAPAALNGMPEAGPPIAVAVDGGAAEPVAEVEVAEQPEPTPEVAQLVPARPGSVAPDTSIQEIHGTLDAGQTMGDALAPHGLTLDGVSALVSALQGHYDFRRARPGAKYTLALRVADKRIERFSFEHDALEIYEVKREGDALVGHQVEVKLDTVQAEVYAEIRSSLYDALNIAGEHPGLATKVVDVFAWDIDFREDTKPRDRFRVVVDKIYKEGEFIRYGRIYAAEYVGTVGTFRTFWFDADGKADGGYYLEDGKSARKTFLKTPLKFARISSGFSKSRKHPVLGYNRAHMGIDYAAPRGTPVWSMASGTVTYAGWKGPNGRLVKIRHANGLESGYAHLHRITRGLRKGSKVKQGQVIGQVGTTGRSTGPHLHFAVKRNGTFLNPAKLKMTRGAGVAKKHRRAFKAHVTQLKARLARIGRLKAVADAGLQ
jgi:murein DD-endopeptidase MepM/ murein hydrolase activator NlpD